MMKNKTAKLAIIPAVGALAGAAFLAAPAQATEGNSASHQGKWQSSNTSFATDHDYKKFTSITDLLGVDNVDVLNGGIVNADAPLVDVGEIGNGDILNGNGSNNATPIASGNGDILSGNDIPVASGNDTDIPVDAPVASGNDVSTEAPVASGNDTAVEAPVEAPVGSGNDIPVSVDGNASGNETSNKTNTGLSGIGAEVTDTVDDTLSGLDDVLNLDNILR